MGLALKCSEKYWERDRGLVECKEKTQYCGFVGLCHNQNQNQMMKLCSPVQNALLLKNASHPTAQSNGLLSTETKLKAITTIREGETEAQTNRRMDCRGQAAKTKICPTLSSRRALMVWWESLLPLCYSRGLSVTDLCQHIRKAHRHTAIAVGCLRMSRAVMLGY